MAIAEYTSKPIAFVTTEEQAEYLNSLPNKSEFIREAIAEKLERENKSKDNE